MVERGSISATNRGDKIKILLPWSLSPRPSLVLQLGLTGVMKTKTGHDKFYGNYFNKTIFLYKILLYDVSYIQYCMNTVRIYTDIFADENIFAEFAGEVYPRN